MFGFHGCEETYQNRLLNDIAYFRKSHEDFDWLGHGMYFWENNPKRALFWAQEKKKAGKLNKPAVIGAVIDLGYCFDLLDSTNISILKKSYNLFKTESEKLHNPIPKNIDHPKSPNREKVLRYLDCAVIQYTHKFLDEQGEQPFDSLRAAFIEGDPIYPDAGFNEKTHIQICIVNPNCIKGFFLPRKRDITYMSV
jgi:hypothetical protein